MVEVEEDELGIPVTALFHVKVPPRHNGVFQVNVYENSEDTYINSTNQQFEEKYPDVYQHEIAIISEVSVYSFSLLAMTSMDNAKTLHISSIGTECTELGVFKKKLVHPSLCSQKICTFAGIFFWVASCTNLIHRH